MCMWNSRRSCYHVDSSSVDRGWGLELCTRCWWCWSLDHTLRSKTAKSQQRSIFMISWSLAPILMHSSIEVEFAGKRFLFPSLGISLLLTWLSWGWNAVENTSSQAGEGSAGNPFSQVQTQCLSSRLKDPGIRGLVFTSRAAWKLLSAPWYHRSVAMLLFGDGRDVGGKAPFVFCSFLSRMALCTLSESCTNQVVLTELV